MRRARRYPDRCAGPRRSELPRPPRPHRSEAPDTLHRRRRLRTGDLGRVGRDPRRGRERGRIGSPSVGNARRRPTSPTTDYLRLLLGRKYNHIAFFRLVHYRHTKAMK